MFHSITPCGEGSEKEYARYYGGRNNCSVQIMWSGEISGEFIFR